MYKIICIGLTVLLLIGTSVFADDVSIDSDGNVETGVSNPNANLEVTGASSEDAIAGSASGTGGAGVYGINTDNNNYGILGYDNYGVFGKSDSGYAGYFEGNARVTGSLTVDGEITGYTETDPVYSGSPSSGITSGQITNWDTAYGWGDHSSAGYLTGEADPQVGSNTTNYVSKWNGSALVAGTIYDNGNVGIGTVSPIHKLDVWGSANTYIGYFYNDNNTSGQSAYGLYAESNAYDTLTGRGYGGLFYGYGGSTSGEAFGTFNLAKAYGTSTAYGVYSDATGGTTTGREWAFYGLGDGYFYGDVGIGTTNPSYKLDVRGSANAYLGYFLNDNNTSDEYAYGLYAEGNAFDTLSGKGYGGVFYGYGGSEDGVAIGTLNSAEAYGSSAAYGVYSNATGGSTTGREWAFYGIGDGYFSGNVGIGTATPNNLLDLGSSAGKKLAVYQNSPGTDFYGFGISSDTLEFYAGAVSAASPSMVLKKISGNVGIGTANPGYRFHVVDSQDSMTIARFENTSVHPASDGIEIKIGPTSNPASNNVFIYFRDGDGTDIGHVNGNGIGGVNYVSISDARLKTNIDDFTGGLDMVSRMKVRKYEFIEAPGNQSIGFLAQELQTVFPQAVSGDPEDDVDEKPMGVDYGRVTPVLVSAIQELKAENESLKAEIKEIKDALGL